MILKDSFQQKFRISTQKPNFDKKFMGCFDAKKIITIIEPIFIRLIL